VSDNLPYERVPEADSLQVSLLGPDLLLNHGTGFFGCFCSANHFRLFVILRQPQPTAGAKRGFFYDAAFTHTMMSLRHAAPGNTGPLTPQSLGSRSRAPRPRPSAPASFPPAAIILSTKLVAVGNPIHSRDVGPCEAGAYLVGAVAYLGGGARV
jgi:hypothetical protein